MSFVPFADHPRRPRGSQSSREKRRDESFQVRAKTSSETQGQSVESGEKTGRKFSSTGENILGDPGAVSRVGRKDGTKVFKYGRKSPWVPTLTELFPKTHADAGS